MNYRRPRLAALCVALLIPGLTIAALETQQVLIQDPVFAMTAFTMTAPAGWHVEGTVLPPASCDSLTPLVFRATSPDGSAGRERLPSVSWAWGAGIQPRADCNLAQHPISAADFLTYYMRQAQVGFVKTLDLPVDHQIPPLYPGQTEDRASVLARYSVDSTQMAETLSATVDCLDSRSVIGTSHICEAQVVRSYAPDARLEGLLPTFRIFVSRQNDGWMNAWTDVMRTRVNGLYQRQTPGLLRQGALAEQQRMQAHNAYMASMQAGADRRDIQFREGQYRKQRNTDDLSTTFWTASARTMDLCACRARTALIVRHFDRPMTFERGFPTRQSVGAPASKQYRELQGCFTGRCERL